MRAQVIALVRVNLLGDNAVLTENGVIAYAVARSSCFAGLRNLIDVQIGCATRAMAHWTRGDLSYYLTIFPVLCQLVASAHKPKVAAAMLYKMERLLLYNERHPDIITFFSENCLTLRETTIENWHSILTHYVNRNVAVVTHDNYLKATCVAQQCRKLKKRLNEELLKKKPVPPERLGLLLQLQSDAFDETNTNVADFLLEPFRDMVMQLKADGRCSGKYAGELKAKKNLPRPSRTRRRS